VITASEIDQKYNGWSSYDTWNVALWLQNDEPLYRLSLNYTSYEDLRPKVEAMMGPRTPDGVEWDSPLLNTEELDEMLLDLLI
tara:strand:- start:47 stop:295 length:249 start_codon:yes stop_codon:yes gene_type:complete